MEPGQPLSMVAILDVVHCAHSSLSSLQGAAAACGQSWHQAHTISSWQMPGDTRMEVWSLKSLKTRVGIYQVDREGMKLWTWTETCVKALGHQWNLVC